MVTVVSSMSVWAAANSGELQSDKASRKDDAWLKPSAFAVAML
ncbi:hypothetical protein [Brucella pseudintermedia]|nr:hypothetical protein [Brucella pseudintermedia]WPM79523.1 hypothetical protein R5W60_10000 [Brucella pseudintermedia]